MTSVFPFLTPSPAPKLHITTSALGGYIDPSQPPTKHSPWREIHETPFIHSATMIMPDELYQLIYDRMNTELLTARFAKIIMPLTDILTGDFFTHYTKTPGSNILMLSEGKPGVDDRFELRDGVLKMELCKETYEKCGLQGKPVRGGGRKHVKARYEVVVDLRKPEMVKGKKGFDRLLWTARNVLERRLCWLFVDLKGGNGEGEGLIERWHPTWVVIRGEKRLQEKVLVPETLLMVGLGTAMEDQDQWYDIVEWLDLVALGSSRITSDDEVDTYFSRYTIPSRVNAKEGCLRVIKWGGLLSSDWIIRLLIEVIKQSRIAKANQWLTLSVGSHRMDAVGQVDGYTIVLQGNGEDEDMEMTDSAQKEKSAGFQRSMCFQFVDSNTAC